MALGQSVTLLKGHGWNDKRVTTSFLTGSYLEMPWAKVSLEATLGHVRSHYLFSVRKDMCFLLLPGFLLTSRADPSQNCLKKKKEKKDFIFIRLCSWSTESLLPQTQSVWAFNIFSPPPWSKHVQGHLPLFWRTWYTISSLELFEWKVAPSSMEEQPCEKFLSAKVFNSAAQITLSQIIFYYSPPSYLSS